MDKTTLKKRVRKEFVTTLTNMPFEFTFDKVKPNFFKKTLFVFFVFLFSISVNSQTSGLIYKPAGNALGKSVLDPNGDGYISLSSSGFSGTDYGANSELNMVPLPIVGGEPTGDLTTGGSGGPTDIVSVGGNTNQSCYILYKSVSGTPYLIFRFRLGGSSTASKGYSVLFDTDGVFNGTGNNPGYEKEVVMNTGSSGGVVVNTFDASGNITNSVTYDINNYTQRSVALTTISGNADYFYDFFIPYSTLGISSYVRLAAATISSAGSGISGTKSDYNGINDGLYGNNSLAIANALIKTFPSTDLTTLTSGGSFSNPDSSAPVVNGGLTTSSTSISGTSVEADGTTITIYKNGISIGTASVSSGTWVLTGVSGLLAGDNITAKATASGKNISAVSNTVQVTGVQSCYTVPPTVVSATASGNAFMTISWVWPSGATTGATASIEVYQQTAINTYVLQYQAQTLTYPSTTLSYSLNFNGAVKGVFVARVTYNSCTSSYSNQGTFGSINPTPTNTVAPTIQTSPIYANVNSQNVVVLNNHTASAVLTIYVNSTLRSTSAIISAGQTATFSLSGLMEGDILTARAQGQVSTDVISNYSSSVIVEASSTATSAPVISESYIAGTGKTILGTSTEAAGTIIYVYNGVTLIGTATVTNYGTWSLSGITLVANNVLTAYAKATGKTLSTVSNSVTVQASAPTPPTVTGSYQTGATSVTGTGGLGTGYTVTVYVDGSPIGTVVNAPASWSLNGIANNQLYKGSKITATNTNISSGIVSILSNEVVVTGVSSFLITNTSDASIGSKTAGVSFPIKIVAKDGAVDGSGNGTGNTISTFNGSVVLTSCSAITQGAGQTTNFSSGILTP